MTSTDVASVACWDLSLGLMMKWGARHCGGHLATCSTEGRGLLAKLQCFKKSVKFWLGLDWNFLIIFCKIHKYLIALNQLLDKTPTCILSFVIPEIHALDLRQYSLAHSPKFQCLNVKKLLTQNSFGCPVWPKLIGSPYLSHIINIFIVDTQYLCLNTECCPRSHQDIVDNLVIFWKSESPQILKWLLWNEGPGYNLCFKTEETETFREVQLLAQRLSAHKDTVRSIHVDFKWTLTH